MKIMKILRKILKNYIKSKNRHFKVFFNLSYFIKILFVIDEKYKFYKCKFLINLYHILFYYNIMIICLILKYI